MADKYDLEPLHVDAESVKKMICPAIEKCEIVFSSPTKRAYQTAMHLFKCNVKTDKRISPREIGEWAGLSLQDIYKIEPKAVINYAENLHFNLSFEPPGAESNNALLSRLNSFLDMLYKNPHEQIGIVTHSMICCIILALYYQTPIKTATIDYKIEFYKVYELVL